MRDTTAVIISILQQSRTSHYWHVFCARHSGRQTLWRSGSTTPFPNPTGSTFDADKVRLIPSPGLWFAPRNYNTGRPAPPAREQVTANAMKSVLFETHRYLTTGEGDKTALSDRPRPDDHLTKCMSGESRFPFQPQFRVTERTPRTYPRLIEKIRIFKTSDHGRG